MAEPSHAFLLRCWKEPDGEGEYVWRFLLIDIDEKQEKKSFANLEAVVAFLRQRLKIVNHNHSRKSQ